MVTLVLRHAAGLLLAASLAASLECLPRRTCPENATASFMCVGYTDAKTNKVRLLCDGAHTGSVAECEDYYKNHGAADVTCCNKEFCLEGSKYDNSTGAEKAITEAGDAEDDGLNCYVNGPVPGTLVAAHSIDKETCAGASFCVRYEMDGETYHECINYPNQTQAHCEKYFMRLGGENVKCCDTPLCNVLGSVQRDLQLAATSAGTASSQPSSLSMGLPLFVAAAASALAAAVF